MKLLFVVLWAFVRSDDRESLVELLSGLDAGRHETQISQSRRRIWKNNGNACYASGDSDAANTDCYDVRYNALSAYYPLNQKLKTADRHLILSEYATEQLMDKTLSQLDRDISTIVGNDGTVDRPSVRDGLVHETTLLKNATAQLQRATMAAVDALYASVINVTQISIDGTKTLKSNIAASYSNLMAQVNAVAAKQNALAVNQTGDMLNNATATLSNAAGGVTAGQQSVVKSISAGSASTAIARAALTANVTKLKTQLSDAPDAVAAATKAIADQAAAAGNTYSTQVGDVVTAVADATNTNAEAVKDKSGQVTTSLKDQSGSELSDASAAWSAAAQTVATEGQAKIDDTNGAVSSFADNSAAAVASASANLTDSISAATSDLKNKAADASKSTADLAAGASALSSQIAEGTTGAKSTVATAATNAQASAAENQKSIQALILSASHTSGQTVQSIIAALGGAQSDAQSGAALTAEQQQAAISAFLAQIGNDNTKAASVLSNLQSTLASSTSTTQRENDAALSGATGATAAAGSALTGGLDSASSTLAQTQAQLAAQTSSATHQIGSVIASGTSTTGSAVGQFSANSAQIANALRDSILAGMSGFETAGSDTQAALTDLTHALQATGTQVGSAAAAATSVADSMDDSIADSLFGVSDADDGVAETIANEMKAQKIALNQFGSSFGSLSGANTQALWSQISHSLDAKKAENDKIMTGSATAETSALAAVGGVANQAAALASQTDSLVSEKAAQTDLAHSDFESQLALQSSKDDTMVGNFKALLGGYANDALGDMSTYIASLLSGKSGQISQTTAAQKSELQTLLARSNSAGALAAKLASVVAAIGKNANSDRDGLIAGIVKLLDTMDTAANSMSSRITNVQDNFHQVKADSAASLAALLSSVQAEVLKIPQILTSGAVKLQNDFQLASSDLQNNILKLKEKLATAQTDDEREAAMQGLVVLNKLQGLQQGVQDADASLRASIEAGGQQGQINSENVQGAMTGVLAAMSSINAQMDTSRVTVQSNTEQIGKQTATLVNGMGMYINQTSDQLANEAAQAAVASRFDLNMAQARSKVRAAAANRSVKHAMDTFGSNSNAAVNDESEVGGQIGTLQDTAKSASVALGSRIDSVLSDVLGRSGKIQNDASMSQSDILSRLALVRIAMSSFLGLWNEYAASMDRKFKRFHSTDGEFIAQMERDIRTKLGGSEVNVNATNNKLAALKQDIEQSMQEEIEFENTFNTKISESRASLKDLNTDREQKTAAAADALSHLINLEAESNSNVKDSVKSLIDKFDAAVGERINQISQSPEISSVDTSIGDDGSMSFVQK